MDFDAVVGNPPYQAIDGGAYASASPVYQHFVEQAKKINPRYISMIIPARWYAGGKGLDGFREEMLHDERMRALHDFVNASDCFSGVEIKSGVCFFLRDRSYKGECDICRHEHGKIVQSKRYLVEEGGSIFIRYDELIAIKNKVWAKEKVSFISIVSSRKPYGIGGDAFKDIAKYGLPPLSKKPIAGGYKILGLDGAKRSFRFMPKDYPLPKKDMLDSYKLFVPRNWGCGDLSDIPSAIYLASPGDLCTETFIQIGPFQTDKEAQNALSYFKTKFFRALVGVRKQDQGASKSVYQFVPMQDFSKPWTDEELYAKYGLSDEEIWFIESRVKGM